MKKALGALFSTLALLVLAAAILAPMDKVHGQNTGGSSVSIGDRITNLEKAVFGGPNTVGTIAATFVQLAPAAAQTMVGQTLINTTGFVGPHQDTVAQTLSGDGAITAKMGTVVVSKGTAAAITIAAPTAVTDDGKLLRVFSTTAAAHVITSGVDGFNAKGTSGTCTFGAAIGNGVILQAFNGHWYVVSSIGNTTA